MQLLRRGTSRNYGNTSTMALVTIDGVAAAPLRGGL